MPYKDPEAKKAANRRWRAANPGYGAKRWAEHREREAATNARSRARHAETRAAEKAAWQRANRDRAYASAKRHRENVRAEMIAAYGGRCACCGESEPTFLTLDHANGGGGADRRARRQRSNQAVVAELRRLGWPQDGFRILCWNCQFGTTNGRTCPHAA